MKKRRVFALQLEEKRGFVSKEMSEFKKFLDKRKRRERDGAPPRRYMRKIRTPATLVYPTVPRYLIVIDRRPRFVRFSKILNLDIVAILVVNAFDLVVIRFVIVYAVV